MSSPFPNTFPDNRPVLWERNWTETDAASENIQKIPENTEILKQAWPAVDGSLSDSVSAIFLYLLILGLPPPNVSTFIRAMDLSSLIGLARHVFAG